MRKVLCTLLILVLMVSFVGCGSSPADETAKDAEVATEGELEGSLTMWHAFTQGSRNEALQLAADDFMALHPGVSIEVEAFPRADFETKWSTGLATGNVPDISSAYMDQMIDLINLDAIIPLDDVIDDLGRDRFFEAPLVEMTLEGNTYAVPLYSHAQVMWYRKDLLDANGLEIPTTWDELYDAAVALTDAPDVYGLPVPMGMGDIMGARYLNFYVRSAGGRLLNDDGTANITSPEAIEGIKYWVKMYENASPEGSVNYKVLDQATMYYQGKAAFDFNSGFHIGGVASNSPDLLQYVAAAPMPTINKGDEIPNIETSNVPMVIWKASDEQELAKEFLKFLYEDERYIAFLHSVPGGMLPAFKDIAEDERFLSHETIVDFKDSIAVIADAVNRGTAIGFENGPVKEAGLLVSQNVIEEMFQSIVLSGVDVEEAAADAEAKLNELFETLD